MQISRWGEHDTLRIDLGQDILRLFNYLGDLICRFAYLLHLHII